MNEMVIRFRVNIAYDEETGYYHANIYSMTENKVSGVRRTSLRKLLYAVNKLLRDKNSEVRHFPIPEQSAIIAPSGKGDISLIIPARN